MIRKFKNSALGLVVAVWLLAVLFSARAAAQGTLMQLPPLTDSMGHPIAGATISVFTTTGNLPNLVCNAPVTVYKDVGLTLPFTTLTTDGNGNFPFFISPSVNPYGYTVSGQNSNTTQCYGFTAPINIATVFPSISVTGNILGSSSTIFCLNGDTGLGRNAPAWWNMGTCTPGDQSGTLALSLLFEDQTFTAAGSVGSPSFAFKTDSATGLYHPSVGVLGIAGDEHHSSGKVIEWNSDTGISRTVANTVAVGNGNAGDISGTVITGIYQVGSSDTGITRTSAKTVAIGNGTQGDTTGTVKVENAVVANFDSVLWVDGIKYTTLAGCYAAIASTGGVCKVPPGYTETLAASITMNKNGAGFDFTGPAVITMGSNQITVSAGTSGAFITGPMDDGGQLCFTLPCSSYTNSTEFIYTGNSAAFLIGAAATPSQHVKIRGLFINLIGAGNAAIGIDLININGHFDISQNHIIGSGGAPNTQIGLLVDGGGTNFTCDGEADENFIINTFIGIKTANMSCENVYKGNQIAMVPGTPANSICVDFEDNSFGNTILGGNFFGCTTVWKVAGTSSANYGQFPINSETNDVNFGGTTSGNMMLYFGQAGASNAVPVVTDTGTNNTVWSPNGLKITGAGLIRTYGGLTTTNNGVADFVAEANFTGQTANIGGTTVYAVPAAGAGMYRVSFYEIVTTVAGVSSTLPNVLLSWTDPTNNTAQNPAILLANTGNTLTTVQALVYNIDVKASTNIQISTTGYASNPATTMQYKLRVRVEKMD